jgi:hypothetical protein
MRSVAPEWRNLAEGLLRIETLEARFRAEWVPQLEEARRKRNEAERQRARIRGRATLIAAPVIGILLCVVTLVLLLFFPLEDVFAIFVLALVALVILVLYGVWSLLYTPDFPPVPLDLSGRWWHTVSGRSSSSVRRSGPVLEARYYGDQGEEAFVSYLARALPKDYIAVRGLLVARNLDADLIVVGPTGVWVYEVKHWTGEITCERGE